MHDLRLMGAKISKSAFRFKKYAGAVSFALLLISIFIDFPTHASETQPAKPGATIDQVRTGEPRELDELQL